MFYVAQILKSKKIKNAFYFGVGPLISAFIGFLTVPIITWLVSPEDMGRTTIFTLFQTLVTSFVYLGLDHSFVREYNNFKNKYEIKKLLYNSLFFPLAAALVIGVIILIFSNDFSLYLFSENNQIIIFFIIIWIPSVIIDRFLFLMVRMDERGKIFAFLSILSKILVFVITILLLFTYSKSYKSVILGILISQIISCAVSILIYYIIRPKENSKLKFDKKLSIKLLKFGLPMIPANIIVWALNSNDRIVLEKYVTLDEIGIYFVALKLVTTIAIVQTLVNNVWIPIAYKWYENKVDNEKYTMVMSIVTVIMTFILLLILFLKPILITIFPDEYNDAQYILPFLLISPIMSTIGEITALGISFSKKTYLNIYISMSIFFVNVFLNFIFVPILGARGAALSTGVAYILFFIVRTIISRKNWYNFDMKFIYFNIVIIFLVTLVNTLIKEIFFINVFITFIALGVWFLFFIKNKDKILDMKNVISAER